MPNLTLIRLSGTHGATARHCRWEGVKVLFALKFAKKISPGKYVVWAIKRTEALV